PHRPGPGKTGGHGATRPKIGPPPPPFGSLIRASRWSPLASRRTAVYGRRAARLAGLGSDGRTGHSLGFGERRGEGADGSGDAVLGESAEAEQQPVFGGWGQVHG